MKKCRFILVFLFAHWAVFVFSQPGKAFWKEDFSSGKMPEGWLNVDVFKKGCEWIVTDQPYPGSWMYQQQAPPIASTSRGFHLQYQAGWITDEDGPKWVKKNWFPDCYIQTCAINCMTHHAVVLSFEHTFRWMNLNPANDYGLFVQVSNDSIHWKEYSLLKNAAPASDMFIPRKEFIDISELAADQKKVFLRFYWRGMLAWYWMIDDITLAEPPSKDLAIVGLVSHKESGNDFTEKKNIVLLVRNNGTSAIKENIPVWLNLDGTKKISALLNAGSEPILPFTERQLVFPYVLLEDRPSHKLKFTCSMPGDENLSNDSLTIKILAGQIRLGNISSFKQGKNEFEITAGLSKVKLIYYNNNTFRIWASADGEFTNPAADDIVVDYGIHDPRIEVSEQNQYYLVSTPECALRIYKRPLRFALYDDKNKNEVFEEAVPLILGRRSYQQMKRQLNEHFYGCGMQNGYFSHTGKTILIEKGGGWDNGGRPNPAPFYMSSAGYGAFRNTYDAGEYVFTDTVKAIHNENRFDCWYFYGSSFKKILDEYTRITGRPFLPPRWALSLGDANCYNRGKKDGKNTSGFAGTTPDVIPLVADQYIKYNMPRGWILPNDGYGCGYTKLDSVVKELHKRGFYTGLWTENGLEKIAREVGEYGTRLCKLDVAWVGAGYKFALDACKAAYNGIENNSDSRGFVWSVMGWAGTQRYSVMWTGDQSGNWEYIRFHIPTIIGSGLSAQNYATGDVDGIFGGSDKTYTRDLQWKCFTPCFMSMSGWAKKDKQPYQYGEPFTSINRKYLQLKQRFTPYMYSYCHEAYQTGVPTTRAMILEFPSDTTCFGTQTQYQFMNGEWLLVAPVYKDENKRDSIYFPAGRWIDYWTGENFTGPAWLNNYTAPIDRLPLFVRAGAILPMHEQMMYDAQFPADTLSLDIYPEGKSTFNLYEDDGISRLHRTGEFAFTGFQVNAAENRRISISIQPANGIYKGMPVKRIYKLEVHARVPESIKLGNKFLAHCNSVQDLMNNKEGWTYLKEDRKGCIIIRTDWLNTSEYSEIMINY